MNITGKSIADIVASIRQLVQSGQLEEGALLPPIRELAEQLGVNRNTVAAATGGPVGGRDVWAPEACSSDEALGTCS